MNNKEFIAALAKKRGLSSSETAKQVDALLEVMVERLKENDQITVSNFGVFEVKMRKERISVNPKTGQRMLIPPKLVPAFRPSTRLKDKFK